MQIVRVGLNLATHVFEGHAVDASGRVVLRKTLRRDAVAQFFSELPACVVGMEACSGAHYWAKVLADLGHEVRLVAPQFVKPYVKSNKNDRNDAEAICEAAADRPCMRFVPVRSTGQLAIQAVHRIRQRLVGDRTRLVNQIRGLLAEHGVVIARDITRLRHALVQIVEGSEPGLNELLRDLVCEMKTELAELDRRLAGYNRRIEELFRSNEMCQRIGKIEGIGPITATALVAAVGDRSCFRNGRQFAAWLGLVPRQQSSGGKARLFGISKRGDQYLRTLMIHGARAVLGRSGGKQDARSRWIGQMRERRHPNVVAVALANKNARIAN
jgi:transposase